MIGGQNVHSHTRWALLAIGGAHIDRIGRVSGEYRPAASNPGHLHSYAGGGSLNALRNARLRGLDPVALISARGGDADGATVGNAIEEAGITDMSAVFLDRATASYTAILDHGGELVTGLADMDIYETALPRQLRRRALRDAIAKSDALLCDGNLPSEALRAITGEYDRPVFAIAISPAKVTRFLPVAQKVTVLFMNRNELTTITGEIETGNALHALEQFGFRGAVITQGSGPVLVHDGETIRTVRHSPSESVADVTGAGDALAGATIAYLLQKPGCDLAEAVRDGVAAAQTTLTVAGPVAESLTGPGFDAFRNASTISQAE
jgi:sugar/nucleoside kinase (ribokinase family)